MERRYDDASSVSSRSAQLDAIMGGRTAAEIHNARNAEERKQLAAERQRMLAEGDTLMDAFERGSEASVALDNIVRARTTDPKVMKEERKVDHTKTNSDFFRQAEVSQKVRNAAAARYYDSSMQRLVDHFVEKINEEINEAATV